MRHFFPSVFRKPSYKADAKQPEVGAVALTPLPIKGLVKEIQELHLAGRLENARAKAEIAIAHHPRNVNVRIALAKVLIDLGRSADAVPHLQLVLSIDPLERRARQRLKLVTGSYNYTLDAVESALVGAETRPGVYLRAAEYLNEGSLFADAARFAQAGLDKLTDEERATDVFGDLLFQLAFALEGMQDFDNASTIYDRVPVAQPIWRRAVSHQTRMLGSIIATASRERLVTMASRSSDDIKIAIVRHLSRLRNFNSACGIAGGLDPHRLSTPDLFLLIRCFLSGTEGVRADVLLDWFLRHHDPATLSERDQRTLADLIFLSGASHDLKVFRLGALISSVTSESARRHARYQEFRVKLAAASDIDVLDYSELDHLKVDEPTHQLRFVQHFKAMGYIEEAKLLLERLHRHHGIDNAGILLALLKFDAEWPGIDVAALPERHLGRLDLLQLAYDQRQKSEAYEVLFERCLKACFDEYPSADLYRKDQILNRMLRLDLLHEIEQLTANDRDLPDTVLPPQLGLGLRCIIADDFLSARNWFMRVMEEDSSDAVAAQGLRLALPRTGGDMASIIAVRDRLGYGITGAGRIGSRAKLGSDKTIGLLMSGRYKEGLYSKRHADHWQLLKRIYGDRFYNYERLPAEDKTKSLFVIGDEGVGDEVRTAQFYAELANRFGEVTITCDPRLIGIFNVSFPNITFVPCDRLRKGLIKATTTKKERISGFNLKLSQILTEDCKDLMDRADYITFGQNLFFNRFIGVLPRPDIGGYLTTREPKACSSGKLKVGLLWRSHFVSMWRKFMYLKVEDFAPLLALDGIEFWSMQHCINDQEREFCRAHGVRLVEDVDLFDDFDGMAPILGELDLMIGISSLPMELAAAIGTPVWMLGFSPENYYLRTTAGKTESDQLTHNSTIVAPEWIDFSAPASECVDLVMAETCRRLRLFHKSQTTSTPDIPYAEVAK